MSYILGFAALTALLTSVLFLFLIPLRPGGRLRLLGGSGGLLCTSVTCATLAYGIDIATLKQGATENGYGSQDNCSTAMNCWLDKTWRTATFYCPAIIERFAEQDYEWTDGLFEPKFNRFQITNPQGVEVTMIGDNIRFQNGSGGWSRMTYECDVLQNTDIIVDVRVEARN